MAQLRTFLEKRYGALLLALLFLGVLVRLPLLNGSFWLDEAAQALESSRPFSQQLLLAKDFQPPLYHLLVHGLIQFGRSEWWLRLASLIPALGSVVVLAEVVRGRFGKTAALLSALLISVSSLHVFFSQELRPYMVAVFLCLMSWLAFDRWVWQPARRSRVWMVVFLFTLVASWYTSYVAVFWWSGLFCITFFWRRSKVASFLGVTLLASALFSPWIVRLREQLIVGAALRENLPGWEDVVSIPLLKAVPLTLAKFVVGPLPLDIVWHNVGPIVVFFLAFALAFWKQWKLQKKKEQMLSLILLFVVPLFSAWFFSFFTPVLAPKRVLFLLPVFITLLGVGAQRRWMGRVCLGLFLFYQGLALIRYWTDVRLQRENWRGVVAHIEARFPSDRTGVVMGFDEPFAPWNWYRSEPYEVVVTGTRPVESTEQVRQMLQPLLAKDQIIVFDYLRDLTDPYRVTESALQSAGYREIGALDGQTVGFVRVFTQNRLYAGRRL